MAAVRQPPQDRRHQLLQWPGGLPQSTASSKQSSDEARAMGICICNSPGAACGLFCPVQKRQECRTPAALDTCKGLHQMMWHAHALAAVVSGVRSGRLTCTEKSCFQYDPVNCTQENTRRQQCMSIAMATHPSFTWAHSNCMPFRTHDVPCLAARPSASTHLVDAVSCPGRAWVAQPCTLSTCWQLHLPPCEPLVMQLAKLTDQSTRPIGATCRACHFED